jgi:hypothetical protein
VPTARKVVLDDRLLLEELLAGPVVRRAALFTTTYWYYRACRAAVVAGGGHLSGPFKELPAAEQEQAILSLLELRDDIDLPAPRTTVPAMARLALRHPTLNLLNLEAVAVGHSLGATLLLSKETARGVLPAVLAAEGIRWELVERT